MKRKQFLPVTFYEGRQQYCALMSALDESGASFRIELQGASEVPDIQQGKQLEYYVSTPHGKSKCKGRVTWIERTPSLLVWDIVFTEIAEDARDPLPAQMVTSF